MADAAARAHDDHTADWNEPLIAVPVMEGSTEVVRYFTSEADFDRATGQDPGGVERALSLIGAWQHLDDEDGPDMLDELDRMRHESKPTPSLEL
jgi:hypothetical protein